MATQIFSFPQTSIPTGNFPIPQTALGVSLTSATFSLARRTTATPTIWPNATTKLNLTLEVSYDGGATFLPGGGFTAEGGIAIGKLGVEVPNSVVTLTYSQSPTHIRGNLQITGGPLVTSGTLTVA